MSNPITVDTTQAADMLKVHKQTVRFNKTESPDALHLALWYYLLHLAFGERT